MKNGYFILILLAISLLSCNKKETDTQSVAPYTPKEYILQNKIIGVQNDDIFASVAKDIFHARSTPRYTYINDMKTALRQGRIDAILTSASYSEKQTGGDIDDDLDFIYVDERDFVRHSTPIFADATLANIYNEWLQIIKKNTVFDEIVGRWLGGTLPEPQNVPIFYLTNKRGVLKVCDTDEYPPYIYRDGNGNFIGFDMELVYRFAQFLEMSIEINTMPYEDLLPFVRSGQADMSACLYEITDPPPANVAYGMPVLTTKALLIVTKNSSAVPIAPAPETLIPDILISPTDLTTKTAEVINTPKTTVTPPLPPEPVTVTPPLPPEPVTVTPPLPPEPVTVTPPLPPEPVTVSPPDTIKTATDGSQTYSPPVITKPSRQIIKQSIHQLSVFVMSHWLPILYGILITLLVALVAQVLATALGAFLCYLACHKNLYLKAFADIFSVILCSTPVVIVLMLAYYIAHFHIRGVNAGVAILAFTLINSAMIATTLKNAIHKVAPAEVQSAFCLGFSAHSTFLYVTLPQALRIALPAYLNSFIELIKATAIVGYILLLDMTYKGFALRHRSSEGYMPLAVTIIYVVFVTIIILLLKLIAKCCRGGDK